MKGIIMKKEEERNIYAVFDDKTIRVYQAYNNEIADEALKLGKFGSKFSLINIQLGQEGGKGLEIFNQNLKKYEFIKENK